MAVSVTEQNRIDVTNLYVALFGRAPDGEGLGFWSNLLANGTTLESVADTMFATEPARAYYPSFFTNEEIIESFYLNVLGRPADAEGLAFWTTQLNAPGATPGSVIVEMVRVVTSWTPSGVDPVLDAAGQMSQDLFNNKAEVALYYGLTNGDIAGALVALDGVTADDATVIAAKAAIDGGLVGETSSLTTGGDAVNITTLATVDTIIGVVDGDDDADTSGSTFSIGDIIDGNGKTILNLAIAEGGNAAFATVKDVATIDLLAGTSAGVTFNAVAWENIGAIQLNAGVNGANATFSNLHAGVDLSVGSAIAGSLSADYTDGRGAYVYSDKGASIAYMDGGDINATAAAGKDVEAYVWANQGGVDLTVGNVTFAGAAADSATFSVTADYAKAADITIGNVSMTGFNSVDFGVYNTSHSASSPAGNVTVGDVTLSVGDSGSISATIYNYGSGVVGNTTVGDVALTVGADSTDSTFYLYQWGGLGAGDVTVGDVSVSLGASATSNDVYIENYAGWSGVATAAISQGAMTVGDVSYDLAMNASAYFSVNAYAYTYAAGVDATQGDYRVGDLAATLAQGADLDFWLNNEVSATDGAATLGDTVVGNMNFDLAVDASLSVTLDVSASSGAPTASVGNVTVGNLDLNMGINSYASIEYTVYAYGTDSADVSIGDVTIGDLNAVLDDGAHLDYSLSITSYGDLGNVDLGSVTVVGGVSAIADIYWSDAASASNDIASFTVGDVSLTAGQNADLYMEVSATAYNDMGDVTFGDLSVAAALDANVTVYNEVSASNDIGKVSIGNIDLSAAKNAYIYASHDFSAWNGAIGNVDVGDVSVAAATSASAYYNFYMSGETAIGDVTIGDVSVSALGKNASASAYFEIENDNVGTIGDITVGDVGIEVKGESAYGRFYVSASSAASGGTVTVGDLSLSVGSAAGKTGAYLDVSIGNDLGDVVVGDITLTGSTVRAAGDIIMTYSADVSIWASGDASIGMITVTGGDGASDNFRSFGSAHDWNADADTADHGETSWLDTAGVSGDVTIAGVDYSAYGKAAWIDVSGFKGAATIKGSAFGDLITDNKGTNSITGGAGADTFTFLDTNTGKTLATMDKLLDFNNAAGDKINLSAAVNVGNYGEASYADFAAFVTGVNAADKTVFVGLVGSTGYVAVDNAGDGTVDFMIELTGLASLGNIDVASFV